MDAAFNMQIEIANLAERVVEPVATKLEQKELDAAADQIRNAFARLNTKRAAADEDFEAMAIAILAPLRTTLSDAHFARVVDRLRGRQSKLCCCSSSYGSVPRLVGNCTDRGEFHRGDVRSWITDGAPWEALFPGARIKTCSGASS
jgi:hypothetical protein